MNEPDGLSIFISWIPLLLSYAIWLYLIRRWGYGFRKGAKTQADYLEAWVMEMQRMNQTMDRIAQALETRAGEKSQ